MRHQRTCDVLFDLLDESEQSYDRRTKAYVYKMIETLLPKTMDMSVKKFKLGLMEL